MTRIAFGITVAVLATVVLCVIAHAVIARRRPTGDDGRCLACYTTHPVATHRRRAGRIDALCGLVCSVGTLLTGICLGLSPAVPGSTMLVARYLAVCSVATIVCLSLHAAATRPWDDPPRIPQTRR